MKLVSLGKEIMRHSELRLRCAVALVLAAATTPIFAADDDEAVQLQEVVVTGSRIRQTEQGSLPISTTVVPSSRPGSPAAVSYPSSVPTTDTNDTISPG